MNDAKKIKDNSIKKEIKELIEKLKSAKNLQDVSNIKKLAGYKSYYRARIKNYRIGLFYDNDKLYIVRCLHRKDIYKFFP